MPILDELCHSTPLPPDLLVSADKRLCVLRERVMADPGIPFMFGVLAYDAGASACTLTRCFQDELDVSLSRWRQQAVLANVIPMMSQGMPLSCVAQELGHNSQGTFSTMFRRAFGSNLSASLHRPGGDEA